MSTFTGIECDPGDQPSTKYAPTKLDVDQWIRTAREAGMKYAVLTSKHVSGHCLWDSKAVFRGKEFDYDVATSGNQTDVIKAFVEACGKHGITPGVYYCLLDFHNNSVPQAEQWLKQKLPDDFFQLAKDQLTELATNYPSLRCFWLDIPRAASPAQRAELYGMLRRLSPRAVVMFNHGIRGGAAPLTIGSDNGASWPTDVLNSEREVIHQPFQNRQEWHGGTYFLGYEHCDVVGKDWFWTAGDQARPVETLYALYDGAVNKMGGNLLLDVGPDREGRLQAWQVEALMQLKRRIDGAGGGKP